ncbi:MAG TPA: hypothetical protein VJ276_07190 [Thermoanaerobaculia bacterium]|nr:hypothetical protein [Thermoanaerobaculia bacterium]
MRKYYTIALAALLGAALFLATHHQPPAPPDTLPPLASWLAKHPADWMAASRTADLALDTPLPDERRFALWRAAHALSSHLAPLRTNPHAAFVRAGLFHWAELSEADRAAVMHELEPLLRDRDFFHRGYRELFALMGDMSLLRRANPGTIDSLTELLDLSAANGRFDDYRALRTELQRKRLTELELHRAELTPIELVQAIPPNLDRADEPLVAHILELLAARPLDVDPHRPGTIDEVVDYALRRNIGSLSGIDALVHAPGSATDATRARLALATRAPDRAAEIEMQYPATTGPQWRLYHLERAAWERRHGNPELAAAHEQKAAAAATAAQWEGLCGTDVCEHAWRTVDGPQTLPLRVMTVQRDEVPPYVEVLVDDLRVAESPIETERTFDVPLDGGTHRIEVRLINPWTRNRLRRLVRLG